MRRDADVNLHAKSVGPGADECAVQRSRLLGIAHDRHCNETGLADVAAVRIEIDPPRAGKVDLCPGVGRSVRLRRCHVRHGGEVARGEAGCQAERPRGVDHQQGEVPAAAVAQLQGLDGRLNPLGVAAPIEESLVDTLREPREEFEDRDLTSRRGQELARPSGDGVVGSGIVAMDAMGEVGSFVGRIVDGKGRYGILGDGRCRIRGGMLDADGALERQFGGNVGEPRDRHVVAEGVLHVAQAGRGGPYLEIGFDDALVVRIAGAQHHAVFAEGDRVPVPIGRDVPDRQCRHDVSLDLMKHVSGHGDRPNETRRPAGRLVGVQSDTGQPSWIQVVFICVNLSKACRDLSRPLPDCL